MKWLEPVNWKTMVDNCSDNYHVPTTPSLQRHASRRRYLGRPRLSHKDQFESPNKHVFVNGHSLTFREASDDTPRYVHGMSKDTFPLFQEYHDATLARGRAPARRRPRAPGPARQPQPLPERRARASGWHSRAARCRTEFWHFVLLEKDAPEAIKRVIRIGSQANNGAAGHVRAGRRRQLAPGDGGEHEPSRPPARPGSVDGARSRGRASGLPGARVRALHLREQPAALLPALGGVHERRELGGHPPRPDHGPLRGHRHHAG